MSNNIEDLLNEILPGKEIQKIQPKWQEKLEKPIKFWKTKNDKWAIFYIEGDIISQTKIDSIIKSKELQFKPLVIINDHSEISALAKCYLKTSPHMLCQIAGNHTLINPPAESIFESLSNKKTKHRSRIPVSLLKEIIIKRNLPGNLKTKIKTLIKKYKDFKNQKNRDEYEQKILEDFGNYILRKIGFTSARLQATSGIRSLELSKLFFWIKSNM